MFDFWAREQGAASQYPLLGGTCFLLFNHSCVVKQWLLLFHFFPSICLSYKQWQFQDKTAQTYWKRQQRERNCAQVHPFSNTEKMVPPGLFGFCSVNGNYSFLHGTTKNFVLEANFMITIVCTKLKTALQTAHCWKPLNAHISSCFLIRHLVV